jgi:hypothetical protein
LRLHGIFKDKDHGLDRMMLGIMDELESMSLCEPDHAAIGSQDVGKQLS